MFQKNFAIFIGAFVLIKKKMKTNKEGAKGKMSKENEGNKRNQKGK